MAQLKDLSVIIFSVGRGNAAFVRTPLNHGFVIDTANGLDGFSPTAFVSKYISPTLKPYKDRAIAQAILSHPHADHIAECGELAYGKRLAPELLTCPHDKPGFDEELNWKRICNPDWASSSVEAYKALYQTRKPPLQTIAYSDGDTVTPELAYGIYYIKPPICDKMHSDDNEYGNATSIIVYFKFGKDSILLPGDMTPLGMEKILVQSEGVEKRMTVFDSKHWWNNSNWHEKTWKQPGLSDLLSRFGLGVLVAPHHGLESCFCPTLYKYIRGGKPQINLISERRKKNANDGKVHPFYQSQDGASGLDIICEGTVERGRRSATTVSGHHILVRFTGNGSPLVVLEKDATKLLKHLEVAKASVA
jgi:hypothetical protein